MEINFPCVCGHPKEMHRNDLVWVGGSSCLISHTSPIAHACVYRPDTLKYLEQQYEVRHT